MIPQMVDPRVPNPPPAPLKGDKVNLHVITVRLPAEAHEAIKAAAHDCRVSMNEFAVDMLMQGVAAVSAAHGKTPPELTGGSVRQNEDVQGQ